MRFNHEKIYDLNICNFLFLISIILVFLDYFNVFSTLGFRMGNINWDFTGMVITNVIVVLLFVITYETLDKRSAEKENNKRLIAISLIKQSYEQCVWYTDTLTKEIVEKYIVPKMNFDGGADENKVVTNLKNAPFENDGAMLSLVYDGQVSVDTINGYFRIKQLFSQYITMRTTFFDAPNMYEPIIKDLRNEINLETAKLK